MTSMMVSSVIAWAGIMYDRRMEVLLIVDRHVFTTMMRSYYSIAESEKH